MRKAFTLIELMIVIAVLAILMSLVFRLSSTGSDSYRRTQTIARLQRLENCLSGYNAAFGSYPPVKLHGTRDIYRTVDVRGLQTSSRNESIWNWNVDTFKKGEYQDAEYNAWRQVRAACKAQPVDCRFPFPENFGPFIETVSNELKRRANSGDSRYSNYFKNSTTYAKLTSGFDGLEKNYGRLSSSRGDTDWRNIQLFKFGLMSYLLPRYLIMMNGNQVFYDEYSQWTGNNTIPANPFDGTSYGSWKKVRDDAQSNSRSDLAKIANMPSQSVCARWMPNLAGICRTNHKFTLFGIDIRDDDGSELDADNYNLDVFFPGDSDSGGSSFKDAYVLDGVTINDGWGREFYYYSPYPHQKYVLWSAGANSRTFPPWMSKAKLSAKANQCVAVWTDDDIVHLSN